MRGSPSTDIAPRPRRDVDATATDRILRWGPEWLVARLVVAVLLVARPTVCLDAVYYAQSLERVASEGWGGVLPEYPLPVALLIWPLALTQHLGVPAPVAAMVPLLALDLLLARTLHRRVGRASVRCWSWGVAVLGPVVLFRLDLVAGALLAGAVMAPAAATAGALLALAVAAKVFPLVALPAALAVSPAPRTVLVRTIGVGGGLLLLCVVVAGWERTLSPLTYQTTRGLQIESVAATPFLVARLLDPGGWTVSFASSKSWEIAGSGTATAAGLTQVAQVAALVAAAGLALVVGRLVRLREHPLSAGETRTVMTWTIIASVCGLIATSRVFSPQYLLWVLPLVAVTQGGNGGSRHRWTWAFLVTLALTQLVYPFLYRDLVGTASAAWPATAALILRNVVFVALTLTAFRIAIVEARGARRADPGPDT